MPNESPLLSLSLIPVGIFQTQGEWRANKIHGQCVWNWNNGMIYQGDFEMNRPTHGILRQPNGGECFKVSTQNVS